MHKRHSLIVKLTLATSLILIGFMVLLDYINVHNFKKVMLEYSISTADQMAEIINQSAYDAMLKNDKQSLYQMIDRIAKGKSVEHIRLIDREGRVAYSSIPKEIGTVIDKSAEACSMCHKYGNPKLYASTMHRSRVFTDSAGREMLGLTNAIYNQPTCSVASCHFHKDNHKVLGLLDIEVSMANLAQKTEEYHIQFFLIGFIMLLITGGSLTFLTQRLVNRPVQRLVKHTTLVSAGDLNSRVESTSGDELGELAQALNRMTDNLKMAHEELTKWGYSLEEKVEERTEEIKKMENQLRRSEKLASLGKLVAGIAHEINNPLTGVLLYSSILESDQRLDPALKPDLERITSESQRCADIVSRLLEFSREAVPRKEAASLNALIDKVINLVHKQPTFSEIEIVRNYAPDLPNILVDPNQMQQVFVNLFINASHAMTTGGVLTLTTSVLKDQGLVQVDVADTGHGIDEEHLNHIFDPFFTTKADGTGLGLSISYGIVENNGGTIEVKSALGIGTTFTITLPIYDDTFLDEIMA